MLDRDLRLVALTERSFSSGDGHHAANRWSALRRAKAEGLPISCGTSINHLTLNEGDIWRYGGF